MGPINKLTTGDQSLVKKINKSIVLSSIEKKGPISRAQVSKETGLNKATVSTMVSELLDEKLVNEIGPGQSSGGRKPVMLYFNSHAGYSIGIDLGANYIRGVLTDLTGTVSMETTEILAETESNKVLDKLCFVIKQLIKKAPSSPYGIVGIGIAAPGLINTEGLILFAPYLNWRNTNIKEYIEKVFQVPVTIENEANAGAHSEKLYGAGKKVSNFVYVSIGIGIGAGIMINDNLFSGSTGIAGETGHFTIESQGKKCRCGNRGCWELYASESALLEEAKKLNLFQNESNVDIELIYEKARNENQEIIQVLNSLGEYIGIGLVNIINTFNPEVIIIGNRMTRFEKWITNPINRMLDERLTADHRKSTTVTFSALGERSNAIGSSSFAISKFSKHNYVKIS